MKDRKKTIATLKDVLRGLSPITELFDDEKKRSTIKVFLKRDGKFFMNTKEITEDQYNEAVGMPNVIHINVKREEAPPIEQELPGPSRVNNIHPSN